MAAMFKTSLLALALLAAMAVPAAAATFNMQRGINLDQWVTWPEEAAWEDADMLLPFPEWRKRLGEAELAELKAAGFDFVRMPVDPSVFLSDNTLAIRERLYAEVLEAARLVNRAGLKVVVDLHLIPRGDNAAIGMDGVMKDSGSFDAYVEVVRRMARTLAGEDPEQVALELMNEPSAGCDAGSNWPDMLARLFAAARSSATRLTLVLSGGCGGSAEGIAALDPKTIPDENIIWTFHSYQPFLLTHQGALWAGDFIRYVTGLTYPPHEMEAGERELVVEEIRTRIRDEAPWTRRSGMLSYLDEQLAEIETAQKLQAALEAPFQTVAYWAKEHDIAAEDIFLGELGMIRQEYGNPFVMPAASRAAYAQDMIRIAEKHGYAWSLWSYGGAFGIVEEFDGRRAEPDVLEMVRGLAAIPPETD